jgi:hypothetical protein
MCLILSLQTLLLFTAPQSIVDGSAPQPKPGHELAAPVALQADGKAIDCSQLIGYSSPQLIDYDGDQDLDLVLGSFAGRYRLFVNSGNSTVAKFDAPQFLQAEGKDIEVSNW